MRQVIAFLALLLSAIAGFAQVNSGPPPPAVPLSTTNGGFGASVAASTGLPVFAAGVLSFDTTTGTGTIVALAAGPSFSGVSSIGGATGTTAARFAQPLDVVGSANYAGLAITDWTAGANDQSPIIDINRSKSSTPGTFTTVASGDTLGYISFRGSDGTAFTQAATIKVIAGNTVATNQVPGDIQISTARNAGAVTLVQVFDHLGHVQTTNVPPSSGTPTSCGTGSPTVVGSDNAGLITEGTTATGCTITFTTAFVAAPFCVVTSQTQLAAFAYAVTTTTIVITNTSTSGDLINYHCMARQGG